MTRTPDAVPCAVTPTRRIYQPPAPDFDGELDEIQRAVVRFFVAVIVDEIRDEERRAQEPR